MPKLLHRRLLLAAHLLTAFVLPGVLVFLLSLGRNVGVQFYLFWMWFCLSWLVLGWVVALLGRQLWQRRWRQAIALALLVGADVLILCGYQMLFVIASMVAGSR